MAASWRCPLTTLVTMEPEAGCVFCGIASGHVPADLLHETPNVLAFRDLQPQSPVHVLVVPRRHHPTAVDLALAEPATLVELVTAAGEVADREGLIRGYRLVVNTGADANQVVQHVHLHVLGGRSMTWPPG